jgi:hypothetical protein
LNFKIWISGSQTAQNFSLAHLGEGKEHVEAFEGSALPLYEEVRLENLKYDLHDAHLFKVSKGTVMYDLMF